MFHFKRDLRILLKNKSYVCLALCFNFLYGIYTSLGAVVNFITAPYDYTSSDNSIFASILIVCGVLGSFIFGIILDKTARYKLVLHVLCFGSIITLAFTFYTLPSKSVALFATNLGFVGLTVVPIIPVSYAFAVELTYPAPEVMSNGMMVLLSSVFGTLLVISIFLFILINKL